ncbi:family 1 glycosylhydrolase [Nannocystis pusilla]|uniref:family 1 glycosylhydrolase n=1 Tax=Nannocystis pusilla TaxID=889268 RepID=UPI003DA41FB3
MEPTPTPAPLELWGGVECTVNRVGDRFHDQLVASGHHHRPGDIDAIADLGVRVVRYPVLWERTERSPGCHDFAWPDRRLALLRARGLTPIVGLVHHGSGPRHTDLLDPEFPRLLAGFAGAVARRYPWVELYTPVNEPLTTARFSGLYGHWYPHHRSDASFCRALVNQCLATQAAMREIRRVHPGARLVHTEDLGAVLATPALLYQAQFENERRFLSHDLLCGRVDREHPMYAYLRGSGIADDDLAVLRDHPPPDLLGANHYITSVRFLDDRLEHYPHLPAGGNGRHRYVDVEAVRVCDDGMPWAYELLHEPRRPLPAPRRRHRGPPRLRRRRADPLVRRAVAGGGALPGHRDRRPRGHCVVAVRRLRLALPRDRGDRSIRARRLRRARRHPAPHRARALPRRPRRRTRGSPPGPGRARLVAPGVAPALPAGAGPSPPQRLLSGPHRRGRPARSVNPCAYSSPAAPATSAAWSWRSSWPPATRSQ